MPDEPVAISSRAGIRQERLCLHSLRRLVGGIHRQGRQERIEKKPKFPDEYKGQIFDQPEHWEDYTGLAINTALSDIVVVDIDVDAAKGKDGWAGLAEAGIKLPETPMKAWTQSTGEHWFYRKTTIPVEQSKSSLAKDVDIRGDASGIVFAFPTVVANGGGKYTWQEPAPLVTRVGDLPEFPEELAQLLADKAAKPKRTLPLPPATPPEDVTTAQRDRLMRVVEYKLEDLRAAPPSHRFDATSVAMRIIGIGKTLGIVDELAQRVREVFPGDEDQIESSIYRAVLNADPEVLPEDDARGFWDQRPELQHIRQAAHARYLSPWAAARRCDGPGAR